MKNQIKVGDIVIIHTKGYDDGYLGCVKDIYDTTPIVLQYCNNEVIYRICWSPENLEVIDHDEDLLKELLKEINQIQINKDKNIIHENHTIQEENKQNPKDISSYPILDLMLWRNTASKRVTKLDQDIKYFQTCLKDTLKTLSKLKKKRQSDVSWIVKLNRILYNKVIRNRD
jgi:hypothetical protein